MQVQHGLPVPQRPHINDQGIVAFMAVEHHQLCSCVISGACHEKQAARMQAEAVLTHRVSAGYSDVEWLVVDAQCLLRDIVQRG